MLPSSWRDHGRDDEHVARLLDRHLVLLGLLAAAVDLAVGLRIRAQVVRGEGELPPRRGGVVEHRRDRGLQQFVVQQHEDRRGRIDHIDRADAAVAEVLLAEEHRPAVGGGDELVGADRLAIGQGAEVGVIRRRRRGPGRP